MRGRAGVENLTASGKQALTAVNFASGFARVKMRTALYLREESAACAAHVSAGENVERCATKYIKCGLSPLLDA